MRVLLLTLLCVSCFITANAQDPLPFDSWPDHARTWANWVLGHMGDDWKNPAVEPDNYGVRGTAFCAAGLALRGRTEDLPRMARMVEGLLANQYDAPGTAWHGTYKRRAHEPDPPATRWREWIDYDPNWREFVGTSLILVRETVGSQLDPALIARLDHSLRLACEGAYARNVRWHYSNISIMSAYLLAWGGRHFEAPEWTERANHLAEEIFAESEKNSTLWEFNSPTYGGVDFFGLGLWRRLPVNEGMKRMGEAMNGALWHDVARFYHADLGNLCGPYDRSYGMNMQHYFAITGIAIDLATGTRGAMPELGEKASKAGELAYLPLLAALDMTPPEDVLPHLHAFQGPRQFSRTIVEGNDARVAHAWLENNWMAGIETNARGARISDQYHPITAHWRNAAGDLCWLRLIGDVSMIVALDGETRLAANVTLRFADKDTHLTFEVRVPGATLNSFAQDAWTFDGMTVNLKPGVFAQETTQDGPTFHVHLTPTREESEAIIGFTLSPSDS